MSSITLPDFDTDCSVNLTSDLTAKELLAFSPFKTWTATLRHSLAQQSNKSHPFYDAPYQLRKVDVQSVDFFGKEKRIGFVKLSAEITNDKGEYLPGSVFLRGGSVAMMLILQPDDIPSNSEQDKHVIMTLQPRIPAGSLSFAELPAGMLDDSGSFAGGAAKEIEEETGLKVQQDELLDLTALALEKDTPQTDSGEELQKAMYPSAGGCDEFVPTFLYQKRIPRKQLKEWQGKLTGLRDSGEKITLKVVRLEDLWREGARDSKSLGAWALYEGLRRTGKI